MTKQLFQAISAVTAELGKVKKDGWNDFHKYKYATEAGVIDAIRPLLAKHGLCVLNSVESVSTEQIQGRNDKGQEIVAGILTTVKVVYTVAHGDSGEVFESVSYGQALDRGDKGLYKALTGAHKYFLMKTFMVATGDDPETESPEYPEQTRRPAHKPANKGQKPASKAYSGGGDRTTCPHCQAVAVGVSKYPTEDQPWFCFECKTKLTDEEKAEGESIANGGLVPDYEEGPF